MTIDTVAVHQIASQSPLFQEGPQGLASPLNAFPAKGPVDLHAAIEEVRRLPEFAPPKPDWLDELLKQPFFQDLQRQFSHVLDMWTDALRQLLMHVKLPGAERLPDNIRDVFSGFIGVVVVVMGLYAFYLLLGWFLQRAEREKASSVKAERVFDAVRLVDSAHHFTQAQYLAREGQYGEGLRQLYLATLCHLDEQAIVPFEKTRSNLEYLRYLAEHAAASSPETLQSTFEILALAFEASRYGNKPVGFEGFTHCSLQYQQLRELTHRHG